MIIINDGVVDEVESFMIEIFELMCIWFFVIKKNI